MSKYDSVKGLLQTVTYTNSGSDDPTDIITYEGLDDEEYFREIIVPTDVAQTIKKYLEAENEFQGEDNTITYTVNFQDGKQMDVKCYGCQEESSWCEAVLFDRNGNELCCSGVEDTFFGDWQLCFRNVEYNVSVREQER